MASEILLQLRSSDWRVPDLSDGAHVARCAWLVYILSNTSLRGTGNGLPFSKCQTAMTSLHWRRIILKILSRG